MDAPAFGPGRVLVVADAVVLRQEIDLLREQPDAVGVAVDRVDGADLQDGLVLVQDVVRPDVHLEGHAAAGGVAGAEVHERVVLEGELAAGGDVERTDGPLGGVVDVLLDLHPSVGGEAESGPHGGDDLAGRGVDDGLRAGLGVGPGCGGEDEVRAGGRVVRRLVADGEEHRLGQLVPVLVLDVHVGVDGLDGGIRDLQPQLGGQAVGRVPLGDLGPAGVLDGRVSGIHQAEDDGHLVLAGRVRGPVEEHDVRPVVELRRDVVHDDHGRHDAVRDHVLALYPVGLHGFRYEEAGSDGMDAVGHDILVHVRILEGERDAGREVRGRSEASGAAGVVVQVGILRLERRAHAGTELELQGLRDGSADQIVQREHVPGERDGERRVRDELQGDHVQREAAPQGGGVFALGAEPDVVRAVVQILRQRDDDIVLGVRRDGERLARRPGCAAAGAGLNGDEQILLDLVRAACRPRHDGRALHRDGDVRGRLRGRGSLPEDQGDGVAVLLRGRQGVIGEQVGCASLAPLVLCGEGVPGIVCVLVLEAGDKVVLSVGANDDLRESDLVPDVLLQECFD